MVSLKTAISVCFLGGCLHFCLSVRHILVSRACEVQLASQSMEKVQDIPVPVLEKCVKDSLNFNPKFGAGEDALAAYIRIVERQDPSYKY